MTDRAFSIHTFELPDGRALAWSEFGAPGGRPVLAFHGTPACRLLFRPADSAAARHGLRLIAPDRPGYGGSSPAPGRTLQDWAADVAVLMDHLRIADTPVLAISGGGPYGIATAAHLGRRITGLALVSPLGETGAQSSRSTLSRTDRALFLGLPRAPRLLRRTALAARAGFLAAPGFAVATFAATLSASDRSILSSPAARQLMIDMTAEAIRPGVEGAVSDLAIFSKPWQIDFSAVAAPAVLWQGTADRMVPATLAFDLGHRLPDCRVHRLEGQGHFWVLEHVDTVIAAVAELPFRA